ncbi:MAG: hypothetical protein JO202_18875 [Ktedonobacteraceae bacterium]|nr:hypothetical protein [Ktedonobacteraceae bacterium]
MLSFLPIRIVDPKISLLYKSGESSELEEEWVREQKAFWTNLEKVYGTEFDEDGNPKPIGYRISAHGLTYFLANRVYCGDWLYDGDWIENNHKLIVPKDLFDFAQGVLEKNRRGLAEQATYHTTTNSVIYDILYPGPIGIKKRFIQRHKQAKDAHEQYRIKDQKGMKHVTLATIDTQDIEQVFLEKFTERLWDTKRFEDYEQKLVQDEENKKIEGRRKNLQDTLHQLTERIDGLFLTLQSPRLDKDEREEFIAERQKLIRRREAVRQELTIQSPVQVYLKYKDLIDKMGKYWERYPFADRQALVALLVQRVYLEPLSHHFIKMTIAWKDFPADVGIIWRPHGDAIHWKPEEDKILYEMYPTEPLEAIQQALPQRTGGSILTRASRLHIRRLKKPGGQMCEQMSIEDADIAKSYGIPLENLAEALFTQWI